MSDVISAYNDTINNVLRIKQQRVGSSAIRTFEIADASITNAKIKSIAWDKAQGGSLILGGLNNTNGLFSLKDATGAEIVHMDNAGITINNGKLTIKNASNTTVLDANGLISTANFAWDGHFDNTTRSTTSTSYVDLPASTLGTFTLTRTTYFTVSLDAYGANTNLGVDSSVVGIQLVDNGSLVFNFVVTGAYSPGGTTACYASTSKVVVFAAGSHTLKLQFKVIGTGTAQIFSYDIYYLQVGN